MEMEVFEIMARKSELERLRELDEQMNKIKARKQQLEGRLKEKERKARTKRLIEVGAIFEKYFEIIDQEDAEKMAIYLSSTVARKKGEILKMTKEEILESIQKVAVSNK